MLTNATKTSEHQGQQEPQELAGSRAVADKRPSTAAQRELVQMMQDSPRTAQLRAMKNTLAQHETPAQRVLITHKPKSAETSEERVADSYATVIDALVELSYEEFIKGDYSGASAPQVALYKRRKYEFDQAKATGGSYAMHPSTAAGYVIEGKANGKISQQLSNVELQVTDVMQGTRPDILFRIPDKNMSGLVDITASNSAGHIFSKKGNWLNQGSIIHVSESVYPSINFESMSPITLSEEDVQQIKAHADEKSLLKAEYFQSWFDRYAEAQGAVIGALEKFNDQNTNAFTGTFTQVGRLMEDFKLAGVAVFPQIGGTKLEVQRIEFGDQKGTDASNFVPFKVDPERVKKLIEKLQAFKIP